MDEADPLKAAQAIGLCSGVLSAEWVLADGSAPPSVALIDYHLGHGVMNTFGESVTPREGQTLLALSTGSARVPGQRDYKDVKGYDKMYVTMPPWPSYRGALMS